MTVFIDCSPDDLLNDDGVHRLLVHDGVLLFYDCRIDRTRYLFKYVVGQLDNHLKPKSCHLLHTTFYPVATLIHALLMNRDVSILIMKVKPTPKSSHVFSTVA